MLAKRFVSAENRGRVSGLKISEKNSISPKTFGLPSTSASIKKIGLVRDSNLRTPACQTSGNPVNLYVKWQLQVTKP